MAEIYTAKEYRYIEDRLGGKLCKLFGKLDAFLAGGAVTSIFANQNINDFDIFFRDKDSFERAKRYFSVLIKYDDSDTKEVCTTERATTYTRTTQRARVAKMKQEKYGPSYDISYVNESATVQLVDPAFISGSPEEVFMGFDFTICMGAYLFKRGEFVFNRAFLRDVARREIVFNKDAVNLVSSLFRAHKYKSKGFTMSLGEEMKLAMALGSKKFKTFGDFVHSAGSVLTEEVVRHLYNHIRHPTDNTKGEEASFMSQPYNAEAIIDWLDELVHDTPYVPRNAGSFPPTKAKGGHDYKILEDAINSDLSEEAIKEITNKDDEDFIFDEPTKGDVFA